MAKQKIKESVQLTAKGHWHWNQRTVRFIKEGWVPVGGITITEGSPYKTYQQRFVKYEN